jgi:hypothetical protein
MTIPVSVLSATQLQAAIAAQQIITATISPRGAPGWVENSQVDGGRADSNYAATLPVDGGDAESNFGGA